MITGCACPVNECGFVPPEFRYTCPNGNNLDNCGCVVNCQCGKSICTYM